MLYYDTDTKKRYNQNTLRRAKKSPNDDSVFPVITDDKPYYNRATQIIKDIGINDTVAENGAYTVKYEVINKNIKNVKADLKNILSRIRYDREIAGTVTDSGTTVRTDRESQSMTSNAYQSLTSGLISETDWKSPEGWTAVTKTELEPIALTVANHVRKCFKAEKTVSDIIESAETVDELTNMNIKESFETAYQSV